MNIRARERCVVKASIAGYSTAGSKGLQLNGGGAGGKHIIDAVIRDCDTLFDNGSGGTNTVLRLVLDPLAGQTIQAGAAQDPSEDWTIL